MPRKSNEANLQLAIQAKNRNPKLSSRKLSSIYNVCAHTLQRRLNGN
jgi:hypothetical protein